MSGSELSLQQTLQMHACTKILLIATRKLLNFILSRPKKDNVVG